MGSHYQSRYENTPLGGGEKENTPFTATSDRTVRSRQLQRGREGRGCDEHVFDTQVMPARAYRDAPDSFGWTPLHLAVRRGHLEAVRALLDAVVHDDTVARECGGDSEGEASCLWQVRDDIYARTVMETAVCESTLPVLRLLLTHEASREACLRPLCQPDPEMRPPCGPSKRVQSLRRPLSTPSANAW